MVNWVGHWDKASKVRLFHGNWYVRVYREPKYTARQEYNWPNYESPLLNVEKAFYFLYLKCSLN